MPTCMGEKNSDIEMDKNGGDTKKDQKSNRFGIEAFAANMKEDAYDLYYPVQRGIVVDPDRATKMLEHIFEHELKVDVKSINVLMTDAPFNTKRHKQEMAEMMLDYFKVKSFSLMNTAVLSLFSTGKTCGLVAECGEAISCTVPVFEGYALPHAMHYIDVAGQDVTKKLLEELMISGEPVKEKHLQYVRDIKEQMCHVAYNYSEEMSSNEDPLSFEERQYELPDNVVIEVKHRKRLAAAEVLFNPEKIGYKYDEFNGEGDNSNLNGGIAKLAFESIKQCDSDLKVSLYNNIVLAGGTTMMNGFYERFDQEMRKLVHHSGDD